MCNRYRQPEPDIATTALGAERTLPFNAGGHVIHPGAPGLVVRTLDGARVLDQMHWGFPLQLAGRSKPQPVNNTRFDKLGSSFWKKWITNPAQRCVIPVLAYAEAQGLKGKMTETWIAPKSGILAWAGLWRPTDVWGNCYSGVMTEASPELSQIHSRMPVLLAEAEQTCWLTGSMSEIMQFERPYDPAALTVTETNALWARPRKSSNRAASA